MKLKYGKIKKINNKNILFNIYFLIYLKYYYY